MKNQLRGCVKINVRGKRLYRFINAVHSRRIGIFQQYVKGETFCAEVYRKDLKKLRDLADEIGVELTSFEYDTLSSEVIRRRKRIGLIIGVLTVIIASLYFSSVVVTIEIQGNETVSDAVILSALEEIGIEEGTHFGQINYIWSENQLRLMVNGISWAGMHRTGHRLVVEVTELVEKPEMLEERLPCNVVAAHDAEIVYTSVKDGQLMHKVGDYVFKGDMLINGVTSDATGHITLHHAMGDILGIYEDSAEFEGYFTKERLVPTGKEDTRRRLKLFSLEIPLYFGENHYEYHKSETSSRSLSVLGKQLPISLKKTKYREMERLETVLNEDELKEELMKRL